MDKIDCRILEALQNVGSLTQADLADRVGSTPSTCLRRVKQLKKSGHLDRCVYLASPQKMERGLKAFITVTTKGHGQDSKPIFIKLVENEPSVNFAYGTTGEVDGVIEANFTDMGEYRDVCAKLFDNDPQIVRYTTFFVMETYKNSTAISVDELERRLKDNQ